MGDNGFYYIYLMSEILQRYKSKPWISWLLVVLARQRKRQFWLNEIHESIKAANLKRTGIVPNHPEWEFRYHGMGLILIGPNKEMIDVNFHDDKCETIDPYFFTTRLFGLETPEVPEARLRFWLPEEELVISVVRSLQGSILEPKDSHVFRLISELESDWNYLSAHHLDFNALLREIEGDDNQLQEYKEHFTEWLVELSQKEDVKNSELEAALKTIPAQIRIKHCLPHLSQVDRKMTAAIRSMDDLTEVPLEPIIDLLFQLNPKEHHPFIGYTVCEFLLKRKVRTSDCIRTLLTLSDIRVVKGYFGNPYDYDLFVLILKYSPKDGVNLLHRVLTSTTPDSVQRSAALMAVIDEEWSNRALVKALFSESKNVDSRNKRYLVAALLNSKHTEFQQIGLKNILPTSSRSKDAVGYTRNELLLNNMKASMAYYIKEAEKDLEEMDVGEVRQIFED